MPGEKSRVCCANGAFDARMMIVADAMMIVAETTVIVADAMRLLMMQ